MEIPGAKLCDQLAHKTTTDRLGPLEEAKPRLLESRPNGLAIRAGGVSKRDDALLTDMTAWEFIASHLEVGKEVEVVDLKIRPDATGYVMGTDPGSASTKLHVKLELWLSKAYGRNFRHSERG